MTKRIPYKVDKRESLYIWQLLETPLGKMYAQWDPSGSLTGLWFDGQKYFPKLDVEFLREIQTLENLTTENLTTENLTTENLTTENLNSENNLSPKIQTQMLTLKDGLKAYFNGREEGWTSLMTLNFSPVGTEFQLEVWELLREIPMGELWTYGEIARRIAHKRGMVHFSAQAVGGAVGRNPVSILIPCHRVVGASGQLTGYAGGLDRKERLLMLEKSLAKATDQEHRM